MAPKIKKAAKGSNMTLDAYSDVSETAMLPAIINISSALLDDIQEINKTDAVLEDAEGTSDYTRRELLVKSIIAKLTTDISVAELED